MVGNFIFRERNPSFFFFFRLHSLPGDERRNIASLKSDKIDDKKPNCDRRPIQYPIEARGSLEASVDKKKPSGDIKAPIDAKSCCPS